MPEGIAEVEIAAFDLKTRALLEGGLAVLFFGGIVIAALAAFVLGVWVAVDIIRENHRRRRR